MPINVIVCKHSEILIKNKKRCSWCECTQENKTILGGIHTKIVNAAYLWAMELKIFIFSVSKLHSVEDYNEIIYISRKKITFKYVLLLHWV